MWIAYFISSLTGHVYTRTGSWDAICYACDVDARYGCDDFWFAVYTG